MRLLYIKIVLSLNAPCDANQSNMDYGIRSVITVVGAFEAGRMAMVVVATLPVMLYPFFNVIS